MATGTIKRHGMLSPTNVSFPYTPSVDGILNILLTLESGGAGAYCYISVAGARRAAFIGTANGGLTSLCVPVKAGDAVIVYAESGIASKNSQYFPIV